MDIDKLIQAAESCKYRRNCEGCPGKIGNKGCLLNGSMEKALLAAKDYYEALIKAERAKVVQEVREWIDHNNFVDSYSRRVLRVSEIREKLDSMADKEDGE